MSRSCLLVLVVVVVIVCMYCIEYIMSVCISSYLTQVSLPETEPRRLEDNEEEYRKRSRRRAGAGVRQEGEEEGRQIKRFMQSMFSNEE